jgi:DNA-nicking Smr family endonuclease
MRKSRLRSLDELAPLKQALQAARRQAAQQTADESKRAAFDNGEQDLFNRTVGPVVPLRSVAGAPVVRPRPTAVPRQRLRDEAAVLVEAISDDFDVETPLDTDEALSFRRRGVGPEVVRKLRRGVWAIQAQLDLHGLRRDEARERLGTFLRESVRARLRCVRVIHGKGLGSPGREPVLKTKVRNWLVQKTEVIAFTQARAQDGGHGALLVLLGPTPA